MPRRAKSSHQYPPQSRKRAGGRGRSGFGLPRLMLAAAVVVAILGAVIAMGFNSQASHDGSATASASNSVREPNSRLDAARKARESAPRVTTTRPGRNDHSENAKALVGIHPLGDGWVIQIVATSGEGIEASCQFDSGWNEEDQRAFESDPESAQAPTSLSTRHGKRLHQFKHRPTIFGSAHRVALRKPGDVPLVFEWLAGSETIHLHVGGPGTDQFVRRASATRCLFVGLGGDDTVVNEYSDAATSHSDNDRFLDGDGVRTRVKPILSSSNGQAPLGPSFTNDIHGKAGW